MALVNDELVHSELSTRKIIASVAVGRVATGSPAPVPAPPHRTQTLDSTVLDWDGIQGDLVSGVTLCEATALARPEPALENTTPCVSLEELTSATAEVEDDDGFVGMDSGVVELEDGVEPLNHYVDDVLVTISAPLQSVERSENTLEARPYTWHGSQEVDEVDATALSDAAVALAEKLGALYSVVARCAKSARLTLNPDQRDRVIQGLIAAVPAVHLVETGSDPMRGETTPGALWMANKDTPRHGLENVESYSSRSADPMLQRGPVRAYGWAQFMPSTIIDQLDRNLSGCPQRVADSYIAWRTAYDNARASAPIDASASDWVALTDAFESKATSEMGAAAFAFMHAPHLANMVAADPDVSMAEMIAAVLIRHFHGTGVDWRKFVDDERDEARLVKALSADALAQIHTENTTNKGA